MVDRERPDRDARVEALIGEGRHADAADLLVSAGQPARAAELYAAVWRWDEAIALTEQAGLIELAYRYALEAKDRAACGRLLAALEERPDQAARAAAYAEQKGQTLDAARLREAAGETEAAVALYERAGELRRAAHAWLALGQPRKAGVLLERRLKEDPDDAESALALGRILAQFGRWEHAVRALQRAAEADEEERAALTLMVACFAAMGMDEAAGSRLDALRADDPALPVTVPEFLEQVYGDPRGVAALAGKDSERMLAGRYRVIRSLGAGATGRVLLAHDAFHEREVAVKVLNVGGGTAGRDAFVRFAKEARVAAGISHPNVVRVFEFNPDGPFLVMEHMAGGTLEERLSGGEAARAYSPPLTWHLARGVLAALEAVHRRGVVHRDLKPANVFFDEAGNVKLGDFGVAHLTDLGATLTGALMGTLAYMSPEQITGETRPDAATDLYSLGVILFRCLTGRLPLTGPDFVAQHLEEEPPLASAVHPALGDAYDAVLARLLAKDPRARFGSADELLGALRPLPWTPLEDAPREPAERPPMRSEPPPAPSEHRYRVLGPLSPGVVLALDELLERKVELVSLEAVSLEDGAQLADRLRAFARCDGPHLQAVFEIDEARSRAVLEHPSGEPLDRVAAEDPRRARAAREIREALVRLHAAEVVHGAVDAKHVVVGRARACLRVALSTRTSDPQLDWAGLDALGGRAAR